MARGAPTRNALDVHVLRLRRRLAPLGLEIRTVRSRGYLLQESRSAQRPDRDHGHAELALRALIADLRAGPGAEQRLAER